MGDEEFSESGPNLLLNYCMSNIFFEGVEKISWGGFAALVTGLFHIILVVYRKSCNDLWQILVDLARAKVMSIWK